MRVLTEPKNAITRQFQKFLQLDKVELRLHARRARGGRGARARPQDGRAGAALDRRGGPARGDVRHPGADRRPQMHHHRGDDPLRPAARSCSPRPRSTRASTRRTTRSGSPSRAPPRKCSAAQPSPERRPGYHHPRSSTHLGHGFLTPSAMSNLRSRQVAKYGSLRLVAGLVHVPVHVGGVGAAPIPHDSRLSDPSRITQGDT